MHPWLKRDSLLASLFIGLPLLGLLALAQWLNAHYGWW
jgi:hypothetical protein